MGKQKNPARTNDNQARAVCRNLRTSARKLNLVAQMIRGQRADKALTDLQFSKRRIAGDVHKTLQSAVANAENNHNLEVDRLVVKEAHVGKGLRAKRFRARARGGVGPINKDFSNLTIVVEEQQA